MGIGDNSPQKGYCLYVHQNPQSLKLYCYNFNGELVQIYNSATEACKHVGGRSDIVGQCCSKKRLSYKGYIWRRIPGDIDAGIINRVNKRKR